MPKEEFNNHKGAGPRANALIKGMETALEKRDAQAIQKNLKQLLENYGGKPGVPEKILALSLRAREFDPVLAIDMISGGVLNDNTQGLPVREEAARNLLSLSVDGRLEPDAALFAAWRASDNLDPESFAGQTAIDRIADLAEKETSAISGFYLRKAAARAPENTTAGSKAQALWLKLVRRLDDGHKLEETRNMAWEAKTGSDLQSESARLWSDIIENIVNSGSLDRAFMETEITLCNERTTGTLRGESHKQWLEILKHYAAQDHTLATGKAVSTSARLYGPAKNNTALAAAREFTAGVLLDLAEFAPDTDNTFNAVIAASAYNGHNTDLRQRITEELFDIVRAPYGYSREQIALATRQYQHHSRHLDHPGGGTGRPRPGWHAPGF